MTEAPFARYTQIAETLWVGGWPKEGVAPEFPRFIINLYPSGEYALRSYQQSRAARIYDRFDELPDPALLHDLAENVTAWRAQGVVLVHCQQGLNRSPLVVALSLIKQGMEPAAAIALLREKRDPDVLFNPLFAAWLLQQGKDKAK